ncbi:hypothetical protein LIER_34930 [Lithospermum erythrorhizon]|uniref:Uncharacterized protein n=1 Tax=Lithospermum erythrorhizon TaxID=34254 RepID=A0AAV3NKY2_LITER
MASGDLPHPPPPHEEGEIHPLATGEEKKTLAKTLDYALNPPPPTATMASDDLPHPPPLHEEGEIHPLATGEELK